MFGTSLCSRAGGVDDIGDPGVGDADRLDRIDHIEGTDSKAGNRTFQRFATVVSAADETIARWRRTQHGDN
jgi:hypothetical protein